MDPSQLLNRGRFACIDGDLYSSTRVVLPHIHPRMPKGAIGKIAVYVDEAVFPRPGLQGCCKAPGEAGAGCVLRRPG